MADLMRFTPVGIALCLILMTWRDLTMPVDAQKASKDIPEPKLSKFAGPTLRFLFW